ncbi:MAG: 30S ribosomal protein S12 methylthiotransferase RimO [Candidatus Omnitrophica bacterium]|nr:30S ribosomal protein S12 methylthiotransferase RimO [Candidatus Omnitrophota bacterium]
MKKNVAILSLGCARNLVDSEVMLGYLLEAGFKVVEDITAGDIAIINTCCFIREAEEESIDYILKACQLKKEGKINKIIVSGCLAQRYKQQLTEELREVDAFVGVGSLSSIARVLKDVLRGAGQVNEFASPDFLYSHLSPRLTLTPRHFAYVKISEGCNHRCSYCIIPSLRGKYRSRPIGSILKETKDFLKRRRVSEINLIGQDTTMYGRDIYKESKIATLVEKIAAQAKDKWVRLLYAHPHDFPQSLAEVIKDEPAVCKYIDLPLQHINDKILTAMRRRISRRQILGLIDDLRKKIPGVAIRTTLIVGFPGETEKEFKELIDFIREMRFERLGIFKYSREKDTPAYGFEKQIPQKVKQLRYEQALCLQQEISNDINKGFLGKELLVLIDEKDKGSKDLFLGRTQYDAPDVDGCVYVRSKKKLKPGDFVQTRIVDTLEYDLVAEAL